MFCTLQFAEKQRLLNGKLALKWVGRRGLQALLRSGQSKPAVAGRVWVDPRRVKGTAFNLVEAMNRHAAAMDTQASKCIKRKEPIATFNDQNYPSLGKENVVRLLNVPIPFPCAKPSKSPSNLKLLLEVVTNLESTPTPRTSPGTVS